MKSLADKLGDQRSEVGTVQDEIFLSEETDGIFARDFIEIMESALGVTRRCVAALGGMYW
jgi:hypothetical protein